MRLAIFLLLPLGSLGGGFGETLELFLGRLLCLTLLTDHGPKSIGLSRELRFQGSNTIIL